MSLDVRRIDELIVESQDLQSDAMRDGAAAIPALEELAHTDRPEADPEVVADLDTKRRRLLRDGGLGLGALATSGFLGTGFGTLLTSVLARPAAAAGDMSVQIFNTASSLENLAVATYGAALTLPFFNDNKIVAAFAKMTMEQHAAHGDAFNKQAVALGGKEQKDTNPKYTPVVESMKPQLTDYTAVVKLAATLEEVAQDTYLANLSMLPAGDTRALMGSVLAVETQHLAVLRAVGALLAADAPQFIAIPTDLANLPAAAGSVAFPEPFEKPDMASPPEEGAVK